MQDTLYYLPAEAHALGWQQQGLAQRLYHQLPPPDHLPLPMAKGSGTTSTQATGVAHAVASSSIPAHADNSSTFSHNASPAAAAWQGRHKADEQTGVHGVEQAFQLPAPFRKGPELAPASLCSLTSLALLERLPLRCCPGSKTTVSGHPLARSEAHQPTHEYAHMMAQGDSVNTV